MTKIKLPKILRKMWQARLFVRIKFLKKSFKLPIRITPILVALLVITPSLILLWPKDVKAAPVKDGPKFASASGDCTNQVRAGSTVNWTNPGNGFSSNDTNSTGAVAATTTHWLQCLNFGFAIPSNSAISGVVVDVEGKSSALTNNSVYAEDLQLVKGGTIGSNNNAHTEKWGLTDRIITYGSSTNMWGISLSTSDVNASNFGAALAIWGGVIGTENTGSVDSIQITVYYHAFSKISQTGYIWENDEDTTSPLDENSQQEAGNTNLTNVKKGERLTLRAQLKNTGITKSFPEMSLFYDNGDGVWGKVKARPPPNNSVSNCGSNSWTCTLVEATNDVGQDSSLAIDSSGNPWISFFDNTNDDLRVAKYVGTGGTGCGGGSSAWTCTLVDGTNNVGSRSSIAIDPSGTPWVSYRDSTNFDLRVAKYVGSGGTGCGGGSSAWTCTTITGDVTSGDYSSIAFDPSGTPWISFYKQGAVTGGLFLAKYIGTGGTSCTGGSTAWDCTLIESELGWYNSIAFDPYGIPWVSYNDDNDIQDNLRIAKYVGSGGTGCSGGSSAWTCSLIESDSGVYTAIAFDPSGTPWVVSSRSFGSLRVAKYVGSGGTGCSGGSSAWTCSIVDTIYPAQDVAIAFDPSGTPWISYYDRFNDDLLRIAKYVGSGGTGCSGSSAWTCKLVEGTTNVGGHTSIAFDPSGTPWISYYDSANTNLRVAKLSRSGEIIMAPGFSGTNGSSLNESHADMTTANDTTNRDDADCIGGGTWNNGFRFVSEESYGINLPAGSGTAQCTEVAFTIDTSQAVVGKTYRFVIASKDAWRPDKGVWKGPTSVNAYASLTIESNQTKRYAKDIQAIMSNCDNTDWGCTAIESANDVGDDTSIAIDQNGNPWISYLDSTNRALRVARYLGGATSGTGCAINTWTCETVDATGWVGNNTSIAIDSFGNPWVSHNYAFNSEYDLRVAKYVGSNGYGCGAGGSAAWTCTLVETTDDVGLYTSIAFDPSGNPWISYNDLTNGNLRVAKYLGGNITGTGCAVNTWTCTLVEATNNVGQYTSIAFDPSGNPWISYRDSSNSFLRVARYVGSGGTGCGGGSSAWTCTVVEATSSTGQWSTSIAFDPSGNPWISYVNNLVGIEDLRVAKYVGSGGAGCTGTTAWTCTTIEATNGVGYYSAIVFDPSGNPWISYHDDTNGDLRVAKFVSIGGTGCGGGSNAWTCTLVDATGDVGYYSSIAIDFSGNPWIVYYEQISGDLRVAKMHLPPGKLTESYNTLNSRSSATGDARYRLNSGYSPRSTSTCAGITDLLGYCGVASLDGLYDSLTGTNQRIMYTFALKNNNPASVPTITWTGRSNIAPSTASTAGDIIMQVYNHSTMAWETIASDTSSSDCNTADCTLTTTLGVNNLTVQKYYENISSNFWLHIRVWQYENASSQTLKTDYFNVGFENTGSQLRGGNRFNNEAETGFDL